MKMVERENYNGKIELFFKSQKMISNSKIEQYEIIRERYVKKVERKLLMVLDGGKFSVSFDLR